jgi:hypothetical protein
MGFASLQSFLYVLENGESHSFPVEQVAVEWEYTIQRLHLFPHRVHATQRHVACTLPGAIAKALGPAATIEDVLAALELLGLLWAASPPGLALLPTPSSQYLPALLVVWSRLPRSTDFGWWAPFAFYLRSPRVKASYHAEESDKCGFIQTNSARIWIFCAALHPVWRGWQLF